MVYFESGNGKLLDKSDNVITNIMQYVTRNDQFIQFLNSDGLLKSQKMSFRA